MTAKKEKESQKRKRVAFALRPDLHEQLRKLAAAKNLSMSRYIEEMILAKR